jgi:hypothetical protein
VIQTKKHEHQPTEITKNKRQPIGVDANEEQPIGIAHNNQEPIGIVKNEKKPIRTRKNEQGEPMKNEGDEEKDPIGKELDAIEGEERPPVEIKEQHEQKMDSDDESAEIQSSDNESPLLWVIGKYSPRKKRQSQEPSVGANMNYHAVPESCMDLGIAGALTEEECGGWEYPIQERQQVLEEAARKVLTHPTQAGQRYCVSVGADM